MKEDILQVLYTEEQIQDKVRELGQQISRDYAGKTPLLVSVLKGSFVFMADLVRNIDIPCTIDFMAVSSYGSGTKTTGEVKIIKDLDQRLDGKDVIVVEDILDSGVTLSYLLEILKARGAKSLTLCTFLDKPERRKRPVQVQYSGYTVPDEFIVGYGLDCDEKYRNLPYLGILKPEVYGG
jgi:hypoxanthine phosphoribosyltransferase